MHNDPFRPIRLRWDELRDPGGGRGRQRAPALDVETSPGAQRFLGRVVDGGAAPTSTDRIFLLNPTTLSGAESVGAGPLVGADPSRRVPVIVVGSKLPKAGDILVAFSIGGRWVAETGTPPTHVECEGCLTPRTNLTVSWANFLTGPGSTTLIYDGVDSWDSPCVNQLKLNLTCRQGSATFQIQYFLSGPCPTGLATGCSSPGPSPVGMAPTQVLCSPFLRRYAVTAASCPALASQGYSQFTITQ